MGIFDELYVAYKAQQHWDQVVMMFQQRVGPHADISAWLMSTDYRVLAAALVTTLFLLHIARVLVKHFTHLAEFRGPFIASVTRFWLCAKIASGDSARFFVDINKRYGPIARVGPNHLITDDPGFTQHVLAARSRFVRAPWFDAIRVDPHVTNIVSERDSKKHDRLRHKMQAGYSGRELENLESEVCERMAEFIEHIDTQYAVDPGQSKKTLDIARLIQYLAVDIITHLCFGKPLGFIKNNKDMFSFLKTIETQLPIVQHFTILHEVNTFIQQLCNIPFLKRLIAPSPRDLTGVGVIMGICRNFISERYAPNAQPQRDLLGSFKKHGINAEDAETELTISLVAGSDTTATSMRAILLNIISNPRVYMKLQREIDEGVAAGNISAPITDEESRRLPYLQACIKEGLRRYPPITQLRERMAPPEGDSYNGQFIPGGTYVGLNAWGLQLNPAFGSDANIFRPERWLEADPAQLKVMSQIQELVFGYGSTKCLGIPIATMNLNKIFVELLRRYDISTVDPTSPWKSLCYGIFFQKEFNITVTRRTPFSVNE